MSFGLVKNCSTVVAEVLMTRATFGGSIFMIEGDRDSRFWSTRICRSNCRLVECGGKPNLLKALSILDSRGEKGVVAVADADYDDFVATGVVASANLVRTGCHDLETMLLQTSALDRVLAEYGDEHAVKALQVHHGASVRQLLIQHALPFGIARWLLASSHSTQNHHRLRPYRFTRSTSLGWTLDQLRLETEVANMLSQSLSTVRSQMAIAPTADPWLICHGKDMLALLSLGFGGALGGRRTAEEAVASVLRQSLETAVFAATSVYQQVSRWETANPPYRVFPK